MKEKITEKNKVLKSIGGAVKNVLENIPDSHFIQMEEIRIRMGQPLLFRSNKSDFFVGHAGNIVIKKEDAYYPNLEDIKGTVELLSRYSLYAFSEELKNGFITVEGGNRIGIVGKTVVENGEIKTIRNISALNIRISREIKGCANLAIRYAMRNKKLSHILIISPPGGGKTTLLRDIARQLSDGRVGEFDGQTVGIVDERGEIAACYMGIAQNDVGIRTDVLDCCPKAVGMLMLVRSMAPKIIAVDEIGKHEDFLAIESILNAGITLVCTVHGNGLSDVLKRPILEKLIQNGMFGTIIVLCSGTHTGEISEIYNERLEKILGG